MYLDNLKVDTNAPRRYNFAKKYCGRYLGGNSIDRWIFLAISDLFYIMIMTRSSLVLGTFGLG